MTANNSQIVDTHSVSVANSSGVAGPRSAVGSAPNSRARGSTSGPVLTLVIPSAYAGRVVVSDWRSMNTKYWLMLRRSKPAHE